MAMSGKWKITVDTSVVDNGDSIASYTADRTGAFIDGQTISASRWLQAVLSTEYAEDSPHSSGDRGQFILGVRNDAGGSLADTDLDYAPLQFDADGQLRVVADINVENDFVYDEDSAFTNGDPGAAVLLVRQDTLASSTSADGDYGSFKSTSLGELYVHDEDSYDQLVAANNTLSNIYSDTSDIDASLNNIEEYVLDLRRKEDELHVSGEYGIQSLAVRRDSQGSNVSADGDYASFQQWSEGSLKVVDVCNGSMLQAALTVGTTATALPASALSNRKRILLQNVDSASVWVGSASVTVGGATGGIEVPKGGHIELEAGPDVTVYAIANASQNVRILESA